MKQTTLRAAPLAGLLAAVFTLPTLAQDVGEFDKETATNMFKKPGYSPCAGRNFPTRPYFGDTHLHTAISLDAGAVGVREVLAMPADTSRRINKNRIMADSQQAICRNRAGHRYRHAEKYQLT